MRYIPIILMFVIRLCWLLTVIVSRTVSHRCTRHLMTCFCLWFKSTWKAVSVRPQVIHCVCSIRPVKSLDRLGRHGDMRDDSAEIFFQSFSVGSLCEQSWHGQGCPLFDVVHPAFPLPTTASPTLQGDLKENLESMLVLVFS